MSATFCAEPWKGIFIGPDGKVKTCCAGNIELGDLNTTNIEDMLNGDNLLEIKKSILAGVWHENCTGCKLLDERGVYSQRQRTAHEVVNVEFYRKNINYHAPELLDIRWSNVCNLACNYCNPYFSSVWASLKKQYQKSSAYENIRPYIQKNKHLVKIVLLLGGEPFLQRNNTEFLSMVPDDTKIDIVTNLSVDNLEENSMFKALKGKVNAGALVSFSLSFENVGDKFEYVRHNAKWEKFVKNLTLIKKTFPNHIFKALPLYSVYSAFDLEDFYDFVISNELQVLWQKMEYPHILSINAMPHNIRNEAIKKIDEAYEKYHTHINFSLLDFDSLRNIKQTLLNSTEKEAKLEELLSFHNTLESQYHKKNHTFLELWKKYNV